MATEPREQIPITLHYPYSEDYEFLTMIEPIDFDKESEYDIATGQGFLISSPKSSIKKDMKNPDGIYSSKFGQKLGDSNPYADRYKCECGNLRSRVNHGVECPICHTKCKYVDDDFKMFGWIRLKEPYHIINPKFYDTIDYIMGVSPYNIERKKIKGSKLENILHYSPEVDANGISTDCQFKPDNEPYYGIGMTAFYENFDEIIDFYCKKNPKKQKYLDELTDYRYSCKCGNVHFKENEGTICPDCGTPVVWIDKDMIFTHNIPVFTTHLRPTDIRDSYMYYEPCNGIYNMINRHVHSINKDRRKINKDRKIKEEELFKVQSKVMELVDEVMKTLVGKKGQLRTLLGGRCNFACRAVIRQDPTLRIDQVKLPYIELVKCLQQRIINILIRTYNISPAEAYDIWARALAEKDERVAEIIDAIIHSNPEGLPVIINRNPTINYGSILQMFCIGYTDTLTMSVPLQVLAPLGADFDGDVLNVMHIINQAFFERTYQVFNPRNAMYISRVDGKTNLSVLIQRDTLINANTFLHLGRHNYSQEQLDKIKAVVARNKAN